jgi:NADPH2 dehydrogenase
MTEDTLNLFKPINVGEITLGHRVVMAPLTRLRADSDHVPTEESTRYYAQRASYPGTLIITEGTFMSTRAGGLRKVPGIYSEAQIEAWRAIFKAIHDAGSKVFLQIRVLGRSADPAVLREEGNDFVGPSDNRPVPGFVEVPRALTQLEIREYVQEYVAAARNAIAAGADGVEIHGAMSYLVDQFLHEDTNQRTDEYGGSLENRARFGLEVVDGLIDAIGSSRVAIRLSPWGTYRRDFTLGISPISQFAYFIEQLEKRGKEGKRLAYLSLVEPQVDGDVDAETVVGSNDFIDLIWSGIIIKGGSLAKVAKQVAQRDDRTLIAVGRYFISNPDIVKRIEYDLPFTPYRFDAFYGQGPEGYTDYPFYEE